jgi:hypothetical protein
LIHRSVPLFFAAMLMIACTAAPATTPHPTATPGAATPGAATPSATPTARPTTSTPVPATPIPTPVAATASPTTTDDLAVTGRVVIGDHGYAVTLPDGWLRVDLDEEFMAAFAEALGSDEMADFVAIFGDQLEAMFTAGVSLVAFREEDLFGEFATNVNVLTMPAGGMSMNALETLNVRQIGSLPGVNQEVNSERVALPAGEALRLTYAFVGEGDDGYRVEQYLFLADRTQYWLTVSAALDDDSLARDARAMAECQPIGQLVPALGWQLLACPRPRRGRARLDLAIAEHEHVGHLLLLRQADLVLHPVRRVVDLDAQATVAQQVGQLVRAASLWRSAMGTTTAWTGAHQNGKAPAKCSTRMPMKRSSEP